MRKNNSLLITGLNFIPVVFWMGVIFAFSSMPGKVHVGNPPLMFYVERKGAHIGEYFILMLLMVNFLRAYFKDKKELILLSGFVCWLYAFSDEIHQTFVFGREGKITDVGFDLIGIISAGLIAWLIIKKMESKFLPKAK